MIARVSLGGEIVYIHSLYSVSRFNYIYNYFIEKLLDIPCRIRYNIKY